MGRNIAVASRPRNPRNRSTKTTIQFDAVKRKEFLTGFRKRKNERRRAAQQKLEQEIKDEKKKAKEKAKRDICGLPDSNKKSSASHRVIPEIEHLLPSVVKDYGSHTVSVTSLDGLSKNLDASKTDEPESSEPESNSETMAPIMRKQDLKAANRLAQKNIKKGRAFKTVKNMKSLKDSKKKKNKKSGKSKRTKHHNPKKQT